MNTIANNIIKRKRVEKVFQNIPTVMGNLIKQ